MSAQSCRNVKGDFNLHYECASDPAVKTFRTLIDEHDLQQFVQGPTHKHKHTLDLALVRSEFNTVLDINIDDNCLSDHFLISFEVDIRKPGPVKHRVKTRNIKNINLDAFKQDVSSSLCENSPVTVEDFNNCLKDILNKHAPLREGLLTSRPGAPWLTLRVKAAKQDKRKAERTWKKTGLQVHKEIYQKLKKQTSDLVKEEKRLYVNDLIVDSGSCRELFKICNDLLGKSKVKSFPTQFASRELPHAFNDYFVKKVVSIRDYLDAISSEPAFTEFTGHPISDFMPVTEDELISVILNSPK